MEMKTLVGVIISAFSGFVAAVQPEPYNTDSGIAITPMINAGYKYDDNILSQADNTQSSGIFIFAPSVSFSVEDGINSHKFNVNVESGSFIDSKDDNYVTGGLTYQSHLEATASSRFDVNLEANWQVEPRGTGITEGLGNLVDEPLLYDEQLAEISYEYGRLSSGARIAFDGFYYQKNYSNFEIFTQTRSFDSASIGSTFFYTTNSRTNAFIELKAEVINYDAFVTVSRDSDVYSGLVGVTWEATALTSGTFKIGQQRKNFTDSLRENFEGISWDASIKWQPLTYTTLSVNTSRNTRDPDLVGDYINESIYGVNWEHHWNEKLSTTLAYNFTDEDYSGVNRIDETSIFLANLTYAFRRWVDIAVYFDVTDKKSTADYIVFDKRVVGVDFTFSL